MKLLSRILLASALPIVAAPVATAEGPVAGRRVQAFLENLNSGGGKPMEEMTPTEARAVLAGAQSGPTKLPPAEVSDTIISVDGMQIGLTLVRPVGVEKALPAFMFFHGGGWVIGDYPTHERFVRDLVVESGAAAIFVDYTRSPEAKYPVAIHEAYAATRWVAERGRQINVDGSRLAVVGNSAGGNLAAAVTLQAKAKGTPKIRYQVLFWPVTDANFETGSYHQFANGYFLSRNMMKWFWDNYTAAPMQRKEILASPLQATTDQLKGLPPALIQVAELDVLRDEGEAYGRKLDAAGVDVTLVRYDGVIHDFGLLNAISELPATRAALQQAATGLRRHLE